MRTIYTLPAWRGQGIATALIDQVLAFLRAEGVPAASLHATDASRPIYERVGFVSSNEMRILLTDSGPPSPMGADR